MGEIEDMAACSFAARDFIWCADNWRYYQILKSAKAVTMNKAVTKKFLAMAEAVEQCWGQRPENWED